MRLAIVFFRMTTFVIALQFQATRLSTQKAERVSFYQTATAGHHNIRKINLAGFGR
jgi:hypothetical protein